MIFQRMRDHNGAPVAAVARPFSNSLDRSPGTVPGTVQAVGTLIREQAPYKLSPTAPPSTAPSSLAATP